MTHAFVENAAARVTLVHFTVVTPLTDSTTKRARLYENVAAAVKVKCTIEESSQITITNSLSLSVSLSLRVAMIGTVCAKPGEGNHWKCLKNFLFVLTSN